jgi:hypothetical protein
MRRDKADTLTQARIRQGIKRLLDAVEGALLSNRAVEDARDELLRIVSRPTPDVRLANFETEQVDKKKLRAAAVLDLTTETPLPLADACKLVPPARRGKRTHISTLVRWILIGAKSPSGELVKLEALRIGNRWVTSRGALQRFAERLTPSTDRDPTPSLRTPTARQRASERAAAELEALGI